MLEENKIYCSQRKAWFASTPEEVVRQQALILLNQLGFPKEQIVIEKELKLLPHLQGIQVPERRVDLMCYCKREVSLHPLFLIECKAIAFTDKEMRQLIGYNHFIKAPFVGLINQNQKKLGWFNAELGDYQFIDYFPSYKELILSIK
jgi:hypothetical protein